MKFSSILLLLAGFQCALALQWSRPDGSESFETKPVENIVVKVQLEEDEVLWGTDFSFVLRDCAPLLGCGQDHYKVKSYPVTWTDKTVPLEMNIPTEASFAGSDYYFISLESENGTYEESKDKLGKFTITNTESTVSVTKPASNEELFFGKEVIVEWTIGNQGSNPGQLLPKLFKGSDLLRTLPVLETSPASIFPLEEWGEAGTGYKIEFELVGSPKIKDSVTVQLAVPTKKIHVTAPGESESLVTDTEEVVTWTIENVVGTHNCQVGLLENEKFKTELAVVPCSQGTFSWTIEETPSFAYRIRIKDNDEAGVQGYSDRFAVTKAGGEADTLCSVTDEVGLVATCKRADNTPLFADGAQFKLYTIIINWKTCLDLDETNLEMELEFDISGETERQKATVTNYNFLPQMGSSSRVITLLDGNKFPYVLNMVIENVVQVRKPAPPPVAPAPEIKFILDAYITPFDVRKDPTVARLPLTKGLEMKTHHYEKVWCQAAPDGVDPNPVGTTVPPLVVDEVLYPPGTILCGKDFAFVALDAPCGELMPQFELETLGQTMVVVDGTLKKCANQFWFKAKLSSGTMAAGFIQPDWVKRCANDPDPNPNPTNPINNESNVLHVDSFLVLLVLNVLFLTYLTR